jgi:hypothetical protein
MSEESEKIDPILKEFQQNLNRFGKVLTDVKSDLISQEPYQGLIELMVLGFLVSKKFSEISVRE